MSQTLTISDALYEKLAEEARKKGFSSVETLLETQHLPSRRIDEKQDPFQRTIALQERLSRAYGEMPDSVPMIREDRKR